MKILYYNDGLNRGGIENIVTQLSSHMTKLGHVVHLVCMYSDLNDMVPELSEDVIIHFLPAQNTKNHYIQYFRYFPQLIKLIKEIDPDIIHAHNSSFSYMFLALSVLLSKSKAFNVRTLHFTGSFLKRKTSKEKLRFYLDKMASCLLKTTIVSVSNNVDDMVKELYPDNHHLTIENGIDTEVKFSWNKLSKRHVGIQENTQVVIYVSRICEGKNHITLLNAWKRVAMVNNDALLLLVGDGPLKRHFKNLVKTWGIEDRIVFTGSVDNVEEYLSVADIGVFPSESEGFGLGMLEMMAMQLPVVASTIPVFQNFIKEGETGLFFDTYNSDDMAKKTLKLLNNKSLCEIIGRNARKFVQENYSINRMIKRYNLLYENLIQLQG